MLYLYAFADRGVEGSGLWSEPVETIELGGLVACAGATTGPPPCEPWALRGHDAVVRQLAVGAEALLPARFGALFESAADLKTAVGPFVPALAEGLERVRGTEQMTVRVFAEAATRALEPAPATGTDYLLGLRRRNLDRTARLAPLRRALAPLSRGECLEPGQAPLVASLHHLVARGGAPAFAAALEAVRADLPGLRVAVSGPWAPYAFAPELAA